MGFGSAMGQVVEQGAGGTAGIVGTQLPEHGPLKSLHQFPVRFLFLQPIQGQSKQSVERFQVCVRLGRLFDGLRKVRGGQNARVGLAQAGAGTDHAGFPEVVEGGSPGRFPADLALMKQVKMTPQGTAGFGRPLGQRPDDAVVPGQPDDQEARFPLAPEMEQNPFILKRLAQAASLAEGATREDKRDDSGGGNV